MAITAAVRSQPLPAPFVTAARRVDVLTEAVITVETDEGISGCCGAPDTAAVTGDTPGSAVYAAEHIFAPLLVGRELTADVSECCEKALYGNPGAKAALDVAVHRALAASRGVPLCALLGGRPHELTTDLTISAGAPSDVASRAADAYANGFPILKIKLGTDIEADLQTLRELKAGAAARRLSAAGRESGLDVRAGAACGRALRFARFEYRFSGAADALRRPAGAGRGHARHRAARIGRRIGARPCVRPADCRDGQRGYGQHQAVQMRRTAPCARNCGLLRAGGNRRCDELYA